MTTQELYDFLAHKASNIYEIYGNCAAFLHFAEMRDYLGNATINDWKAITKIKHRFVYKLRYSTDKVFNDYAKIIIHTFNEELKKHHE